MYLFPCRTYWPIENTYILFSEPNVFFYLLSYYPHRIIDIQETVRNIWHLYLVDDCFHRSMKNSMYEDISIIWRTWPLDYRITACKIQILFTRCYLLINYNYLCKNGFVLLPKNFNLEFLKSLNMDFMHIKTLVLHL